MNGKGHMILLVALWLPGVMCNGRWLRGAKVWRTGVEGGLPWHRAWGDVVAMLLWLAGSVCHSLGDSGTWLPQHSG